MNMHRPSNCLRRSGQLLLLAWILILAAAQAVAQVAPVRGTVTDGGSGAVIVGARVHIRASPDTAVVLTGVDGRFELPINQSSGNSFQVSAAVPYDAAASVNFETNAVSAVPGADVSIVLRRIPAAQNTNYQPIVAAPPGGCGVCHTEQYAQWQASNHAHAAGNAWVRDLYSGDGTGAASGPSGDGYVFLENHAPPATGFCATCHAANERPSDPASLRFNDVSSALGPGGGHLHHVPSTARGQQQCRSDPPARQCRVFVPSLHHRRRRQLDTPARMGTARRRGVRADAAGIRAGIR